MRRSRVTVAAIAGALAVSAIVSCAHSTARLAEPRPEAAPPIPDVVVQPRESTAASDPPAEPEVTQAPAPKPEPDPEPAPAPVTPQELFDRLPEFLRLPAQGPWDPMDAAKAIKWLNQNQAGVEMSVKGVIRTRRPKLPSIAPSWAIEVDTAQVAQGRLAEYWIEGQGTAPEKWMAIPAGHRVTMRGKLREVRYSLNSYAPIGAIHFTLEPVDPGVDETVSEPPPLIHKVSDVFPQLPPELRPDKDGTWSGEQLNSNMGWMLRYLLTGCRFESTLTATMVLQPKPEGEQWSLWIQTKGEDVNTYVLLTFLGNEETIRPLARLPVGQKISVKGVIAGFNSTGLDHMPNGRERVAPNLVLTLEKWTLEK